VQLCTAQWLTVRGQKDAAAQPAELQLLLAGSLSSCDDGLSETDVAALCSAPFISADLLRLVLPAPPATAADHAAHADRYLRRFKPLLSNPRLDLSMCCSTLSFPADSTSPSSDAWTTGWGSELQLGAAVH